MPSASPAEKDSMLLAKCMQEILRHRKMEFGLHFHGNGSGYNPENRRMIGECQDHGHSHHRV